MSQRPTHAHPLSLVVTEPVTGLARPVAAEPDSPRPRGQVERGTRGLGAQAKQWRWRSGRELWGGLR